MEDNANLSKSFIQNQKKLYQGVFEARKIKGLWVVAQGLVYDTFDIKKHTCAHKEIVEKIQKNEFVEYFLGLDWGLDSPFGLRFIWDYKRRKILQNR